MCFPNCNSFGIFNAALIVAFVYLCYHSKYICDRDSLWVKKKDCVLEDLCSIKAESSRYICHSSCSYRNLISKRVCKQLEQQPTLEHDSKVVIMQMLKKIERAECECTAVQLCDLAHCDHGGVIVSTFDSVVYANNKAFQPNLGVLPNGVGSLEEAKNILTGSLKVGHSWGFSSQKPGRVLIRLMLPAIITGFAVHHPENYTLPYGYKLSAPKDFSVIGHQSTGANFTFGYYRYSIQGRSTQVFTIQSFLPVKCEFIEFNFASNHGNLNYTAVYGVSVYGFTGFPWFQNRSDSSDHFIRNASNLGKGLNFP